jgi:hypothetical protein
MSGMFRPLEKRPVGLCVGKSMPYGGISARNVVNKKWLLPLSASESPKTKKALVGWAKAKSKTTNKFVIIIKQHLNITELAMAKLRK